MALIPQPIGTKPAAGYPGMWQNMEECNSFTAFAEETIGFGVPVTWGTGEMGIVALGDGDRFVGITLSNIYTSGAPTGDGDPQYGSGDCLGVADMGVIWVAAGTSVTKGAVPFYDPTTGLWHGATGSGRLPIPNAEFDGPVQGSVAPLRIRIAPGGADVEEVS